MSGGGEHRGSWGRQRSSVRARGWAGRLFWIFSVPLALALAASDLTGVSAQAPEPQAAPEEERDRADRGRRQHMERRLERLFDRVDATPEQRQQLRSILDRHRPELRALEDERRRIQGRLAEAFTRTTVDPGEIERLRQDSLRLAERASLTFTRGLIDAAQVLTPEQRRQLVQEMRRHRERPRRWR
jgi:Spy/CpxP family protein refolding chaperone